MEFEISAAGYLFIALAFIIYGVIKQGKEVKEWNEEESPRTIRR